MLKTLPVHTELNAWINATPPLNNGDHLPLAEFKRRYAAQLDIKKAELIEGVVHMPAPVYLKHGQPHFDIITWMGVYRAATPNLQSSDNQSVQLDTDNEVQPDVCMWCQDKSGLTVDQKGLLIGAPDFIVEVAASSAAYDLHDKYHVYRRNQVMEYVVLTVYEKLVYWFQWVEGAYEVVQPDENGIYRSPLFPGL